MSQPATARRFVVLTRLGAALGAGVGVLPTIKDAVGCETLPDQVLYPKDGETNVPTNAHLIGRSSQPNASYALRQWVPQTTDRDAGPRVDAGLEVYRDSVYIPLLQRCRTQNGYTLCAASAELEPESLYAVWMNDPTFTTNPLTFRTGRGPRTPTTVPELSGRVDRLDAEDSGRCGSSAVVKVELEFTPTGEPWILVPGINSGGPMFVEGTLGSFTWLTSDLTNCVRLEQMNWLGERSQVRHPVCLQPTEPLPNDAGAADAGPLDAGTPPPTITDASVAPVSDASSDAADAGRSPAHEDEGCGCRVGKRGGNGELAGWLALAALVFLLRRR